MTLRGYLLCPRVKQRWRLASSFDFTAEKRISDWNHSAFSDKNAGEVMHMVTWIELIALLALIAQIIGICVSIYLNNNKKK